MSVEQIEREQEGDEIVRIRRWRRRQFMVLGFHLRDAQRLMESPVDLAEMRKLIRAGCSHSTAERILL